MHLDTKNGIIIEKLIFFLSYFIPPRVFILDNGIESYFAS